MAATSEGGPALAASTRSIRSRLLSADFSHRVLPEKLSGFKALYSASLDLLFVLGGTDEAGSHSGKLWLGPLGSPLQALPLEHPLEAVSTASFSPTAKALFVVDSVRFRMLARRGILAGEGDVDTFCYSAPWRLEAWSALMRRQAQFLRPEAGGKTNPHDLKKFVDDLAGQAEYGEPKDREWYVVLRAASTPDELGPLEPVESAEWGTHYRLCRIR